MALRSFERFERFVDWGAERFEIAAPEAVDGLAASPAEPGNRDRLLFTFDDGHQEDFEVARWLAERGIKATFFVVPSYIGRSIAEFFEYHAQRGVTARDLSPPRDPAQARGLTEAQLHEMVAMGHRVAAHNNAHRSAGELRTAADLDYEFGEAIDRLEQILGSSCQDFAWSFGKVRDLSTEAASYLTQRCARVYSCARGVNLPGRSRRILLRDGVNHDLPLQYSKLIALGGCDHAFAGERATISSQWS